MESDVDYRLQSKIAADVIVRIYRGFQTLGKIPFDRILAAKIEDENSGNAMDPLALMLSIETDMLGLCRELEAVAFERERREGA